MDEHAEKNSRYQCRQFPVSNRWRSGTFFRLAGRILELTLLVCSATALENCGSRSAPPGPGRAASPRFRIELSIVPIPLENPEDIFAFRVSLENRDRDDVFVNLGTVYDSGRCQHPDAIKLIMTDPRGRSKELIFAKSPGHSHPNGETTPYLVPLPSGSDYSLNLNLREFSAAKGGDYEFRLVPGRYRLRAEFTGTLPESSGVDARSFWTGSLHSKEMKFIIR